MPFRGQAHQAVLTELVADYNQTATTGMPTLSVVTGAPGVGKSRLLLELYRTLAESQDEPAYWPAPDAQWSGYPPQVQPGAAAMTFFWWGIPCPPPAGPRHVQVLGDQITQVSVHGEVLIAGQAVGKTVYAEVTGGAKDVGAAVISDLVPGGATAVALGRSLLRVIGAGVRERALSHSLAEGAVLDAIDVERQDLVERALEVLGLFAERVPVVVAVDDAQWSDPSLRRLLEEISAAIGPIHVVLVLQEAAAEEPWLDALVQRFPGRPPRDLAELDEGDALALVSAAAPRGPHDVALALARKSSGNPRSLSLLLELARVADGEIRAALDDVERMPDRFADQLAVVWDEVLPDPVKRLLSAGALTATGDDAFFVPPLLDALRALGDEATVDAITAAARRGWIQQQDTVARFDQRQHGEVARERSVLLGQEQDAVQRRVAGDLAALERTRAIDALPLAARRVTLETHVRLARDGWSEDRLAAAGAAFGLSALLAEVGDTAAALPLRRETIAWAEAEGVTGHELLNLRSTLLDLLRREGREEELDALMAELAASGDAATAPYWQLSALVQRLARDGATPEGIAELQRLAQSADAEDPNGRLALGAHGNLAYFFNRLGRYDEALAEYRTLRGRLLAGARPGPEMSAFVTDLNIAATLRHCDGDGLARSMAAFDALDAVADDLQRAQALVARLNTLHRAVGEGARFDEVHAPLERAAARARAELGAGHPTVRGTVNVLGNVLLDAGRYAEAVAHYERFPTRLGLPSADGLDVASGFNHASALMRLGRHAEAVPILEAVMSARMTMEPPQSQDTATVVAHLVLASAEAGRDEVATAAVAAFALAVGPADDWGNVAQQRLLALDEVIGGHGHPGLVPSALMVARAVLAEHRDPVGLLYLSQWTAGMFLRVGRFDEAVEVATAAVEIGAILGHEQTRLTALLILAEAQRARGDVAAARSAYREIAATAAPEELAGPARQRLAELGDA